MVWTSVDPAELRGFLGEYGQEIPRQQVDRFDRGPLRDLSDTDLAREIAEKSGRIDALVFEGRDGVVALYRVGRRDVG